MYFSRVELNCSGSEVARLLTDRSADDYRHHQFVWRLFEGEGERKFLYRREDVGNLPRYYIVSARKPQDPDQLWSIETKPYAPALEKGMSLAFSLRANPVVSRRNDKAKQLRHDVVMDHKTRIDFKTLPAGERPSLQTIIRDAGLAWLAPRADRHGFSFENGLVSVDGYEQHRSVKRRDEKPISFSTLDFEGLLTVTSVQVFKEALFHGVGPAKALGCGMLMVRRV